MKVIKLHKNRLLNEKDTVMLLQQNCRETQHKVYLHYAPKMLGVCRQYIKDVQQAEEVLLNGFFKVFTKINRFNSNGSFEGWIRKIMVNECISFLRVKKNRFQITEDITENYFVEETNNIDNQIQNTDYLQQLIDCLKPELRVVFNLYVVEEYKHKEIAKMLNITENASKLRYRKAKSKLQELLKNKNINYGK